MKRENNNLTVNKKDIEDERMRETIRKNLGQNTEVIFSHKDDTDKTETVTHFFTSRIPKIQIKARNIQKTLDVEMSSVEEDNQSLLHHLFRKTK